MFHVFVKRRESTISREVDWYIGKPDDAEAKMVAVPTGRLLVILKAALENQLEG
jgi:hypothetical protein